MLLGYVFVFVTPDVRLEMAGRMLVGQLWWPLLERPNLAEVPYGRIARGKFALISIDQIIMGLLTLQNREFADTCPDVTGMTAPAVQALLNLIYSWVSPGESYLEIGCLHGKTLISAMKDNRPVPTYACETFERHTQEGWDKNLLLANLHQHGLAGAVNLSELPFWDFLRNYLIREPIGACFYDGAHTEVAHRLAIARLEPLLAKGALVVVDDWNACVVRAGTLRGVLESKGRWRLLLELPQRECLSRPDPFEPGRWWNGVAVLYYE